MTTALQVTAKDSGATASTDILAPTLNIGLGVPASMSGTFSQTSSGTAVTVFGGDSVTNVTAYNGYRRVISLDLSDRPWLEFQMAHTALSRSTLSKYAAGGGIIVVFQDTSGNYAGFKVTGGDSAFNPFSTGADGAFGSFAGINNPPAANSSTAMYFHIERARTPDYGSATPINWASIAAYEVHFRQASSGRCQVLLAFLRTCAPPIITGAGVSLFNDLATAHQFLLPFKTVPPWAAGTANQVWAMHLGWQAGDGSSLTSFTASNFSAAFWSPGEDIHDTASPRYSGAGPYVHPATPRLCDLFQSASDNMVFSDGAWASSRLWGIRVRGSTSGICAFNRNVFTRAGQFECAHGSYTDCVWDGHTAAIQVTANTVITRGTIRNGVGHGLRITGAAGNYANLQVAFDNNSTYDLEVGSGGAGTYVLTGASVLNGSYTFKIRNESATNAVTVQIPGGITYSTSTAGGTITVATPATYQSVTITGLVNGSRVQIYDTTSSTELYNGVPSGTSVTWTDSVAAAASRDIRVRIAYVSGATAKQFLEAAIGTCGTGTSDSALSYLANQTADPVYNTNAINGATVTGIAIDDSTDRVTINIGGGAVTWPQIYAYQVYWLFTALGIVDDGAFIEAPDTANYLLSGFKVKNTSGTALTITGGYGRDATSGSVLDIMDTTGGFIFPAPDHVVPFSTGSGLTAGQDAQLAAIASATGNLSFTGGAVDANLARVAGTAVGGAGTDANPWRPA